MADAATSPVPANARPAQLIELGLSEDGVRTFYRALLDGALRAANGMGGAVFSVVRSGQQEVGIRLEAVLMRDGEPAPFPEDRPPPALHEAVRKTCLAGRTVEVVPGTGGNTGPVAWVIVPLRARKSVSVALVLFRRNGAPALTLDAGMHWLQSAAPAVAVRSLAAEREELDKRVGRMERAFAFLAGLVEERPIGDLAVYVVNGLRDLAECARVTLFERSGDRWKPLAVSGAESVEIGSELVKALIAAFSELANERPYALRDLAPEPPPTGGVGQLWDAVAGDQHCVLARVIESETGGPVFGLLFESDRPGFFRGGPRPGQGENQALRTALWLSDRAGQALLTCHRRSRIPFLPLLARFRDAVDAGRLPAVRRRRAIWAACAVLAGLMLILPWRERASGDCALLPRARAVVASEIAGRLSEVLVREGSVVEAGQPIARLDTGALEADLEIARQDRLRQEAEAQRMQGLGEMGNYRVLSHEVERLRQTERRLAGEIERSILRSPIRGVVLTKDVDLRRGEVLPLGQEFCEVASLENWDLRIQVPEDQIGLLLGALESRGSLPVSYVLEARSDLRLSTDLKSPDQIGQAANAEARRNFFYVTLAGLDLPDALRADLRPGYTGRARIDLQRRPLGLVLTRRFVHLLRMHWIV